MIHSIRIERESNVYEELLYEAPEPREGRPLARVAFAIADGALVALSGKNRTMELADLADALSVEIDGSFRRERREWEDESPTRGRHSPSNLGERLALLPEIAKAAAQPGKPDRAQGGPQ